MLLDLNYLKILIQPQLSQFYPLNKKLNLNKIHENKIKCVYIISTRP